MTNYLMIDKDGFYGEFGGAYIPEILHKCVEDLQKAYLPIIESADFQAEFRLLLRDYAGRPSPLYEAPRLSERYGTHIFLKREDLNHTGAHKINNTIGQILFARRMGKKRIIAETGAGQHDVATATVCAMMDMECVVYMGETDVKRQHINVEKMKMRGARVVPVKSGNRTLKDATNEAIRDWCCHPADTFYIIGSTVGPHPYPDMVARLQSVISEEIKTQLLEKTGRDWPDYLMACVGGGSNAAGTIYHYINDPMADGPVIQDAATQALRGGMTLRKLFTQLAEIRRDVDIPLILMGYLNPIFRFGFEDFCRCCREVGIDGMIIPDLPFKDYMERYKEIADRYDLRVIMLITPETSEDRVRLIDRHTSGFIYMVSSASTTGAQKDFDQSKQAYFKKIEDMGLRIPRMVGFGISNQATFDAACAHASGGIVGSRFVSLLAEEGGDARRAILRLKSDLGISDQKPVKTL